MGPLIPLFWTSGDVCPGFQSHGGPLACVPNRLCTMDSSDSPLVPHLPTSQWPASQPVVFPTCYICSRGRMPGFDREACVNLYQAKSGVISFWVGGPKKKFLIFMSRQILWYLILGGWMVPRKMFQFEFMSSSKHKQPTNRETL